MRRLLFVTLPILAISGCGPRRPTSVRIDPALATLVPADTVMLAGIKLDALRLTPIYRKLGADALGGMAGGIQLKDVWEILAASNGDATTFLGRGTFAPAGLEPDISRPDATRTRYKGYTLIGIDSTVLAFVNPGTVLAGRPEAVRSIIDQRGGSTGPPRPLADEIASIPPDNQVWAAGAGPRLDRIAPQRGNLGNIATALRLVERFRAAADLRAGAKLSIVALCRSEHDAESLDGALHAFLALGRLDRSWIGRASDAIRIERQERTVRIDGAVPEDVLESLVAR
jgi:hypothetical protein